VLAKYKLKNLHLFNVDFIDETTVMKFGNTLLKSECLESFSFLPHRFVYITNIEYLVNAIDQIKTVKSIFFDLQRLQMPLGLFEHLCQNNKKYEDSTFFLTFELDYTSEKVIKAM